jgi:translation initiation factor RLI1
MHDIRVSCNDITRRKISAIEASLGNEPTIDPDVEKLPQQLINALGYKSAEAEYLDALDELQKVIDQENDAMARTSVASEALEIVVRERSNFLDHTVKQITSIVNTILQKLFRQAKYVLRYDDSAKIEAGLEIEGREDAEPNSISGGEMDRLSIAVTIAFAHYRSSPIIFFDETLAMLDMNRREDVVNAIKEILPDKIVVFVSHDMMIGLLENIVNMEEILKV